MPLYLLGATSPVEGATLRDQLQALTDDLAVAWRRDMLGFAPKETIDLLRIVLDVYLQTNEIYIDMLKDVRFTLVKNTNEQITRIMAQYERAMDELHLNTRVRQLKAALKAGEPVVAIPGFRDQVIGALLALGSALDAVIMLHNNAPPAALVKAALVVFSPGLGVVAVLDNMTSKWDQFVADIERTKSQVETTAQAVQAKLKELPDPAAVERKFRNVFIVGGIAVAGILGTVVYTAARPFKNRKR